MNSLRGLRRFGFILCFLAFFGSVGGHWIIAQSIAWAQMAVTYSKQSTLTQGLSETFDGKHPCKVCHEIQRGRDRESSEKQTAARVEIKFETYPIPATTPLLSRLPAGYLSKALPGSYGTVDSWSQSPPVPPPQLRYS